MDALGEKHELFSNPQTRAAAILTGCKNISRALLLDDGRVRALDWGLELKVPEGRDFDSIGIRMHDIHLGDGENAVDCVVAEELESQFSTVVMLVPEGAPGATPIGWEMNKERWRAIRSDRVRIHIPPEALLLLRE